MTTRRRRCFTEILQQEPDQRPLQRYRRRVCASLANLLIHAGVAAQLGRRILNTMTRLGMPDSYQLE